MKSDKCTAIERAFRFFSSKIVRMMGCFLGCLRIKDGDRSKAHLFSNSVSSRSRDPLVSRNHLSSLFSLEEQSTPTKDERRNALPSTFNSIDEDNDDADLKAEAKFLKSCGTLLQTPAEIRKASEKLKVLPHDGDDESCKFSSWLPGNSCNKLNWEAQPDEVSVSNIKFQQEQGRMPMQENSVSVQHKSSSSPIPAGQKQAMPSDTGSPKGSGFEDREMAMEMHIHCNGNSILPVTQIPNATMPCKKCVRFECDRSANSGMNFVSLKSSPSHNCYLPDSFSTDVGQTQLIGPKHSPYPTPLKLTHEMETPGTVYPTQQENFGGGKNNRIRTQYVYPVLNSIENSSQWISLKNEHETCQPDHPGEQCRKSNFESVKTPMRSFKANADDVEQNHHSQMPVEASLSQWLKPKSSNDIIQNRKTTSNGSSYSAKNSDDDRPIIGIVAAHWNDDEPSHIQPKCWDGNGIPNSTTKYKEDQKVNWHATPFEERLEKALSDEKLFPQRNLNTGRPIYFDESEESDTATSKILSSQHPQPTIQL